MRPLIGPRMVNDQLSRVSNSGSSGRMRDTTAISEFTGESISTWSEEWRYGCELRTVLAMSRAERAEFFNGNKEAGNRGIIAIRGLDVAERFQRDLDRLADLRASRSSK